MHTKTIILIAGLLCVLLALAGCTGTQNTPPVTQVTVPSSTQTAAPATQAGPDLVVSPTDSIIEANKVNVNVDKDYLGNVNVIFQGGNGLQQVNKIEAVLNRADGVVKTSEVGVRVGDAITLEGTKNTDRLIVYVSMKDGKRYKIIDSLMPYRPRT
jgi:hypothetical protein